MSPEAQRIAIAEARPNAIRFIPELGECGKWCYKHLDAWFDCRHNDPLNDLNAMHEAEKALGTSQCIPYLHNLILIVDPKGYRQGWEWRTVPLISATAAQRAEAFLRTVGKWEGGAE